ncbi:MAG: MoaD/ThiS family protein [Proteobacteria bacterium]|nr:MoaD/ThiS family protein [Pseudomonadota bacterium]
MPIVVIPPPYRGPTQGLERIEVAGRTVRDCIDAVDALYPGFGPQVLDASGQVHRFVKLFRNGDQLAGDVLATAVAPGDQLEVIAAIAGG